MCFSAVTSFGAGAVLSVIGIASINKAKSPAKILFASIPLIFAIQQITEGFVWVSLTNSSYSSLQSVATYNFLFFAQVVWPVWVPFAILKLEPKSNRRIVQKILVGIGGLVSVYLAYCLFTFPVEASVIGYHISYRQDYPNALSLYCGFLYIIATIVPSFISPTKRIWILGTLILISYIITTLFYSDYIVSVWCFFASIISLAVYLIMFEFNKSNKIFYTTTTNEVS